MLKTILPLDMKRVENNVMEQTGVTGAALMERAAAHIARAANRLGRDGDVLCLCGTGNNGGDGLAAMRILASESAAFRGSCWLLPGALSPDAAAQLARLQAEQPRIAVRVLAAEERPSIRGRVSLVIDALFGTGLSRPLEGLAAALCELANGLGEQGVPVLAVDIPSGLDGASGRVLGSAVKAVETVTFHRPKPGLYLGEGLDHAGRVTVGDIGLPAALDDGAGFSLLEESDLPRLLPPRKRLSHKGTYGRVLLWAGKRGMAGAAAVCALAALRTGAGLVTVACPESIVDVVQTLCPCATCIPLPENDPEGALCLLLDGCRRADALGLGCGLGQERDTALIQSRLLETLGRQGAALPVVIDADGLNLLAGFVGGKNCSLPASAVLTPHPAEAARLLHGDLADVLADPAEAARRIRAKYCASVILKGAASVLMAGEDMALNALGTPAMAKGGSGDALTGVLTALLAGRAAGAYSLSELEALQAACGLHGLAGMAAEQKYGERGVLATDLCALLGIVGS